MCMHVFLFVCYMSKFWKCNFNRSKHPPKWIHNTLENRCCTFNILISLIFATVNLYRFNSLVFKLFRLPEAVKFFAIQFYSLSTKSFSFNNFVEKNHLLFCFLGLLIIVSMFIVSMWPLDIQFPFPRINLICYVKVLLFRKHQIC